MTIANIANGRTWPVAVVCDRLVSQIASVGIGSKCVRRIEKLSPTLIGCQMAAC